MAGASRAKTPGTHATNWQLVGADGKPFGPIRWLRAVVVAEAGSLRYDSIGFRNTAGDFNNLQPGRQFSGIWTIRNSGGRTWNGDFRVVYLDAPAAETSETQRDMMGAKPVYSLRQLSGRESIAPGETAEIRFDLIAPPAVFYKAIYRSSSHSGPMDNAAHIHLTAANFPVSAGVVQAPEP